MPAITRMARSYREILEPEKGGSRASSLNTGVGSYTVSLPAKHDEKDGQGPTSASPAPSAWSTPGRFSRRYATQVLIFASRYWRDGYSA